MADLVVDADAVGQLVTYVAPGFSMLRGYQLYWQDDEKSAGQTLVLSVVLSLPLVALGNTLPGQQRPTQWAYVIGLLLASMLLGYLAAYMRNREWVKRRLLPSIGYHNQPPGAVWDRWLRTSRDLPVTIELKANGDNPVRRISGIVGGGPKSKDDDVEELLLLHPAEQDDDGQWHPLGPGFVLPLREVANVTLAEDPTAASTKTEQ